MRRFLLPTVVALVAAVAGSGVAAPSAPSLPTDTQQQVSAEPPIAVPATHSCRVTLMTHDFKNSYGAPFNGSYAPPSDCKGPWAKVVLTLTSTVAGTQFDRDVYVAIGHAVVLDGTTSEPCCTGNATTWTVQRDVTDITPLLRERQPVQVELDNVNDSTYTGVYHTVVSLTFYATDKKTPAGASPDLVVPVSSTGKGGPMLSIGKNGPQRVGASVRFPRNLQSLHAQVFADSHGPCEEFWWAEPGQCPGKPYREIAVYLDGKLAGAAPAYPAVYTGAGGPGLWEPIPAPRAWNLRPYDLDLTPFVGLLTDGRPHTVQFGILDLTLGNGDFWAIAANLQMWRARADGRVRGHLLSASAPANPTDTIGDPTGQGAPYEDTASHTLTFSGDVIVQGVRIVTTVVEKMGVSASQAAAAFDATWTWSQATTSTAEGHSVTDKQGGEYDLTSDLLTYYSLGDYATTERDADGHSLWSTSAGESMQTTGPTGVLFNGVEAEHYGYSDSSGACWDHYLGSQAGEVTVDQVVVNQCRVRTAAKGDRLSSSNRG